jgi:hypothetical protein
LPDHGIEFHFGCSGAGNIDREPIVPSRFEPSAGRSATSTRVGLRVYRFLCGLLGSAFVLVGATSILGFFAYHLPGSDVMVPTGPTGFYFVAFAGFASIGWGGCLIGAAKNPEIGRSVGTATAVALVLGAVIRMGAWFVGDYHVFPGEALRAEATAFLILALAFLWLRPPERTAAAEAGS